MSIQRWFSLRKSRMQSRSIATHSNPTTAQWKRYATSMIDGGADSKVLADSKLFEEVVRPLLKQGLTVRFQARGASMSPAIRDGEVVEVTPVMVTKLRKDDIVLAKSNCGFRLHRIVVADPDKDVFITRGDCGQQNDPALKADQILGLARAKEVR